MEGARVGRMIGHPAFRSNAGRGDDFDGEGALHADRRLLDAFLKGVARETPPKRRGPLEISVQRYPGRPAFDSLDETDEERNRRIPDAWITQGEEWRLIIENKVTAAAGRRSASPARQDGAGSGL